MIQWDDPASWRCPVPHYLSVPDMVGPVIQRVFPGEWNGRERDLFPPRSGDDAERRAWDEAAQRRVGAFVVMRHAAAAGTLPFYVYDPDTCALLPLPADAWACQFDVALARFLRGAFSIDYPNNAAPNDARYLLHYNSTFLFNLYARSSDVVALLRDRIERVECAPDDPHGTAARDAMLMAAIAAAGPTSVEETPPPPLPTLPSRGKYDWQAAKSAVLDWDAQSDVFAEVIRDERFQADVVRYMADWFGQRDQHPASSQLKKAVGDMIQHRRETWAAKANGNGQ